MTAQFSRSLALPRLRSQVVKPAWPFASRVKQFLLGVAWSVRPPRLYGVPATLALVARHYAGFGAKRGALPDPDKALSHPNGLAGICTDMSVPTLVHAYAKGLFPFSHIGPQKWWAPKERMVSFPENVYISKNTRRLIRLNEFDVTFDTDFAGVISACAEPRSGRPHLTWITPAIIQQFTALYEAGYAHSVEVRDRSGKLVGGLYGVAVGKVFFTESMFSRERDASKIGFITLSRHLQHWGFVLNDGKRMTGHLSQLGFTLVPRKAFNAVLATACRVPGQVGRWSVDDRLDIANWEPKAASGRDRHFAHMPA